MFGSTTASDEDPCSGPERFVRAFENRSKKKGFIERLRLNFIGQFKKIWYLSYMRAAANQTRLHICAVSPEPLQIALKRTDVDKGSVKLYKPV